jgi:hypothetical protein
MIAGKEITGVKMGWARKGQFSKIDAYDLNTPF